MPQIEVALEDMEQYVRWTLSPLSERLLGTFWPGDNSATPRHCPTADSQAGAPNLLLGYRRETAQPPTRKRRDDTRQTALRTSRTAPRCMGRSCDTDVRTSTSGDTQPCRLGSERPIS
jgi:hypothetical protein